MKFGVITLQDAPWAELVERWRALENLGIETIWVADHLGIGSRPEQTWFEAWSCITALAHVTEKPRIGPLVSPMTLRNPAVLARTALSVAELSGGRLELGVGSGASAADHALAQVPEWPPKERARLFADWVERLVELLADERLQPKAPVPLTIAGSGPTILRLAARHADRWNTYGGWGLSAEEGLGHARRDNELLDELCAQAGRSVLRSALIGHPFVAETPWRSEEAFRDVVGRWEDAGFEELVFFYPAEWEMPEGSVEPGLFERMLGKG